MLKGNPIIIARWSVEGFHRWRDAPEHRAYLRDRHRHIFYVEIRMPVTHDDREVELHDLIEASKHYWPDADAMLDWSCERIATHICGELVNRYDRQVEVAVFEDNEVGASIIGFPNSGMARMDIDRR